MLKYATGNKYGHLPVRNGRAVKNDWTAASSQASCGLQSERSNIVRVDPGLLKVCSDFVKLFAHFQGVKKLFYKCQFFAIESAFAVSYWVFTFSHFNLLYHSIVILGSVAYPANWLQ